MHWELEFADLFYERGGFDLVLGNPPWVKVVWNESNALSDYYPEIDVKDMKSSTVATKRKQMLVRQDVREQYILHLLLNYYLYLFLLRNIFHLRLILILF